MNRFIHKENIFILFLLIFSASIYFIYPIPKALNGDLFFKLNFNKNQPNINTDIKGENVYFLNGGNYYDGEYLNQYSKFYTKSIQYIPTSFYWKYPINYSTDKFSISTFQDEHYLNIRLENNLTLPIVSLIINPDDFFSYESGIYVKGKEAYERKQKSFYSEPWNHSANFYLTGRRSKRKVFLSIYDKAGKHKYSTYCQARVSGHATRSFPQKSLTLSSSKLVGDNKFETDFFGDGNYYEDFVLRNGGNDHTQALFRDAFMQSFMENLGLFTSKKQIPYNLYINGEYWGIHFLQNKFTTDCIAQRLGVKKKKVTIVENWKLEDGSEREYADLMNFIKKAVKGKAITLKSVLEFFDLENLTLYLAGEIFFANTDWPSNNIKLFKVSNSTIDNSKWHFAFFDLDYGLGYTGQDAVELNMFKYLNSKKDLLSKLYQRLILIPEFKLKLINQLQKFKDLKSEDINNYYNLVSSSIDKHTQRWRKPLNREVWEEHVNTIKLFIKRRYKIIESQIKAI